MKPELDLDLSRPQVEIGCPHCGGVSRWDLMQSLNQCAYCGSILSWPHSESDPDYLVADSSLQDEDSLLDVIALYDAMREASLRRAPQNDSARAESTFELGSGFSDTEVYEIKRERMHLFRLLKSWCIYAPYQFFYTLLNFQVLGRTKAGQKVFQPMFFLSEAIVPAYGADWNFRDQGLQISKRGLKPLKFKAWNEPFLPAKRPAAAIEKLARQWVGQRRLLEPELEPVSFQGSLLRTRRWWVYRPYYYVHAQTPKGAQWFLLDGQFGTIAGTPDEEEIARIENGAWKRLDVQKVRAFDLNIVPFRCPNCGWDIKLQRSDFQICENCTRVLEVGGSALTIQPYRLILPARLPWWKDSQGQAKAWLPFWRLGLSLLFEKKRYEDLSGIFEQLLPEVDSPQQTPHFYIPAFDCWTVAKYDRWAFQFGAALSGLADTTSDSVLMDARDSGDQVVPPAVPHELASALFPGCLPMFTSNKVQARLNALLLKRLASTAALVTATDLVFVPAALSGSSGSDLRIQGPVKPIEWLPLKEGTYPPALQRTVRRWMSMSEGAPRGKAASDFDWLHKRMS